MTTSELLFHREGEKAVITFNRPQARNAMTWEMYEALHDRCEEIDRDDSIRVVVLRGAGGKAFVAGTDIRQFQEFGTGEDGVAYEQRIGRVVARLAAVRAPTIALIDGYAVGGGLTLAAVCDLRICTPDARFGLPIARTLGNCVSMQTCAVLVSLIGPARTLRLVYTASLLSVDEANEAGLVTEIVETADVEARVEELCRQIVDHAPLTMRFTKEMVRRLREQDMPPADDLIAACYGSDDFREGVAAFVEKRTPRWAGR